MSYDTPPFLLVFLLGLVLTHLLGRQLSRRILGVPSLETVVLIWTGLFLALTLQQVSQTYRQRLDMVHQEADSIAQIYRNLQSLPQSERTQMRLLLIAYLDAKLGQGISQEIVGLQEQQFKLCCELIARRVVSEPQGLALRAALDRMISLHYRSSYAIDEHLPAPLMALLICLCLVSSMLLGLGGRHPLLVGSLLALMLLGMATIVDLDDAGRGWVRVDRANLRDLVNIMHQQEQL